MQGLKGWADLESQSQWLSAKDLKILIDSKHLLASGSPRFPASRPSPAPATGSVYLTQHHTAPKGPCGQAVAGAVPRGAAESLAATLSVLTAPAQRPF